MFVTRDVSQVPMFPYVLIADDASSHQPSTAVFNSVLDNGLNTDAATPVAQNNKTAILITKKSIIHPIPT